jgi:serine/threonine protein kinase
MAADPETDYALIERIGRGAFGRVYRGHVSACVCASVRTRCSLTPSCHPPPPPLAGSTHRATHNPWAIKIINLDEAQDEVEDIQSEIAILARSSSPHVVGYGGAFVKGPKLWIIMELAVGSAQDLVRAAPPHLHATPRHPIPGSRKAGCAD